MLSKIQKIVLWIFGAMFIVPEVLWNPIFNLYYEFIQSGYSTNVQPFRDNFLQNSDNLGHLKFVLCFQFLGIALFWVYFLINKKNINSRLVFWIVLIVGFLLCCVSFLALAFALTFNPSFPL